MIRARRARRFLAVMVSAVLASTGLVLVTSTVPAAAVSVCGASPDTTWTGAVSSDWSNAGNWSNGVPSSSSAVCVPANLPNDPTIASGVNAAVSSIEVQIGGTLIINAGSLSIANASSIATLTVTNNGTMALNAALTVDTAFNINSGNVSGSGSITSVIGANFATAAVKTIAVDFTNSGTLTWSDGNVDFTSHAVVNGGTWRANGVNDTILANTFTNSGTFQKQNAGLETISANYINGGTTNVSSGTLTVPNSQTFVINSGTVEVTGSGSVLDRGTGTISLAGGALSPDSGGSVTTSTVNVVGGTLTGDGGTINGNVVASSGTVMPGTIYKGSIGTVNISGNFTQSGALFRVDTSNPSTRDVLNVGGAFTISSGNLQVDGTNAAGNTTYDIATYASISGTYPSIADELPTNPEGYFVAAYQPTLLRLTALYKGAITGTAFVDNNGDGVYNGGDGGGLSGIQVYLDSNNNGSYDGGEPTTSTDGSGNYTFNALLPATYKVRFGAKSGYAQSTAMPLTAVVGSGQTITSNAGYYLSSTISGEVYSDNDLSGSKTGGDTAASGVQVYLDTNNNGAYNGGEPTTNTNGAGVFSFTGVAPGTYKVRMVLPPGGRQTTANPFDTVITSGNDATGIQFGLDAFTGSISGTAFVDSNSDGVRQGGEPGFNNETVFLDLNDNGVRDAGERTALTDASGDFSFTVVTPGTYGVRLQAVSGYAVSTPLIRNITLANNQDLTGQTIGVYQAPSVSGLLYSDLNGDGTQDAGEPGLGGVTVYFDANSNGVFDAGETTAITSATGTYVFPAVAAGTYSVRVKLTGVSTVTTGNDPTSVTVSSAASVVGPTFGIDASGSVSGRGYVDTNGNGIYDAGEPALPDGTVVFLDTNHNGVLDGGETSTTVASGTYSFPLLKANTYDIDVVVPATQVQTSLERDAVVVGMDTVDTAEDIGLFTKANVTGTVYRDTNENGLRDAGEPGLPNITVYLDQNATNAFDAGEPTALTAADGSYTFTDLGPGPHLVRVVLPSGATRTTPSPATINLQSATNATANAIGLDVLGSIEGTVFVDNNGNGTKDAGESTGLNGVTVFIDANHNGVLDPGEQTAVTNNAGLYRLFYLNPGTYDVDVVNPANTVQTTPELDAVTLTLNQDVMGGDVGIFAFGTISGRVFFDQNLNGVDDSDAGILKATVFVDENRNGRLDAGELSALTALDGSYTITGVGPGAKAVRTAPWGSATQTTPSPSDASLQSGSVIIGKTFGFDQAVVGAGDATTQGTGYWLVGSDGRVYNYGAAGYYGSLDSPLTPAVGLAPTFTGKGYWVTTANGGVYTYGDAKYYGSTASLKLNQPILAITMTPSGNGYWLLGADGGVFSYGDARFYGSTGSLKLNKPVVGMTPTPTGNGYWLVASDGGVFAYGDAQFYGSMGGKPLNQPVVGIVATSDGSGYRMVATDGGMFSFGEAPFLGTAADQKLKAPIVGVRARGDGQGYWEVAADGGVFAYGKAPFYGTPGAGLSAPIVK